MNTILKCIIALAICLISIQNVAAQSVKFGVKAGADFSTWGGKDVKEADLNTNIGYHVGGFAEIPLSKSFDLESGMYLSRKGFKAEENLLGMDLDVINTSTYLDLPLLAKYNVNRNYSLVLGPQVSYLLDNKITLKMAGEKESDKSVSGFNRFDFGAVAGMGYQFNNGLVVSANYDFGLISLDDVSSSKTYNRVIKASVGYQF